MKVWAIVVKEAREILRDVGGLIMMFVVPLTLIVVFNYSMGGAFSSPKDRPLRVPVANLDEGDIGAALVDKLDASEWISVGRYWVRGEEKTPLTRENAATMVENGWRNQALIIPPDFSEKIKAGEEVDLILIVDPAVPSQFTGPVEGALQGALFSVVLPEQMKSEMPVRIGEEMGKFEEEMGFQIPPVIREQLAPDQIYDRFVEGGDEGGFFGMDEDSLIAKVKKEAPPSVRREDFPNVYQQTASGNTVMFVFFIIMFIGSSFLDEKHNGTFRRLLAAPVGRYAILAGKLLPALLMNCLQVAVMFTVSILWFGVDLGNSPLGIVLVTICLSLCACGLGLLVATLFRTQTQLSGMGVLIVLVSSALSGAMIPRFIMPEFMKQISLAIPQTWAIEGYLDILARGAGLVDVLPNCGVLLLFAAAFYIIALWRFRFE